MLSTSPHCAASGVSGLPLPQLKRKRSDSSDSAPARDAPVATKLRADDAPSKPVSLQQDPSLPAASAVTVSHQAGPDGRAQPISESSHPSQSGQSAITNASEITKQDGTSPKIDADTLRETLEAQLSLEVLLKHNELRLIDQEIAKCQVALEQLRRCAEIPYPGSRVAGYSQSVSNGTGVAVWAPENGPAPQSPAPWGVVEGPYSRHYSRWLLPDPRFDGGEVEPDTPLSGLPLMEGRTTRGSSGDLGSLAGKTRPQRGSASAKLQALPNGYPAPKDKAGPMLIRRKSDNVLVKLVCLDCGRDNFSSTQGFINHCRIAHSRNYTSHDAAAMESGKPVEVDEAGAVVGGRVESSSTAGTGGFVHPLIRTAHGIEPSSKTPSSASEAAGGNASPRKRSCPSRRASTGVETPRAAARPQLENHRGTPAAAATSSHTSFMGSPATPHLSSLMQSRGVGLDLDRLVGEAKTTVDLGEYSSDEGESDSESVAPPEAMSHEQKAAAVRAGRQPMRTTASQTATQRPGSRKGLDKTSHNPFPFESLTPTKPVPYQSPYGAVSRPPQLDGLREVDGTEPSSNLSPNTIESNQAPSLVSDDDDYEAASDSESPGPSSSEAGDAEEDFGHIGVEDDEDSTTSTTPPEAKSDMGMFRRRNKKKKEGVMSASLGPLSRSRDEKRRKTNTPIIIQSTMNHLHPQTISPQTFQHLLSQYPRTVDLLSRRKAAAKIKRKPAAAAPKTKQKSSWTATGTRSEAEEEFITAKVDEFLALDGFRYEGLPGVVAARAKDDDGSGYGYGYLEKDELVRLMEWKMQHGTFRPALLGMIRSNSESVVRDATGRAFKALTTHHTSKEGDEEEEKFPSEALDILTKALRGVGVATASLVLSLASTADVPFYSDDVYLWVCMGEVPSTSGSDRVKRGVYKRLNGELNVKYTMKEYRELWEGVKGLRERLEEKEKGVSGLDVEKVALVVRHYYALLGGGQSDDGDGDGGDKKGSEGMKVEEEQVEEETKREKRKLGDEQPTGESRRRSKRLDSRRVNPA
ncbi:uncharacterized protein BO88DRAFT_350236 [Aspergillus vadensis CBS 113365]|uniref:AHC1-like C2H2 zinc-finger domain-containing protein n=1 Tax=Aspergillus vadensis (strain CBS 113365 / IMI 142717 / IBT 24658) TaxID=1448311 RepID=A0A319AWT5_ASPVC|nr:hypothetical protein BO88DRAFT_350236 [Aspergillus vadensis CBS 113365]PYH64817.1 hypothetical protein BO88DRAFT_350236 [Aspergillus vadensis CBS 113365]